MDNPEVLLTNIINLAIAAGEAIMQVYDSPFSVEYKEDNSPLTLADKNSHEVIEAGLKKCSGYPLLSEEMAQADYEVRKGWKTFWLVDPLDGTKEFVKRNGEFTVNIALIEDGKPIMGVIYLPVHRVLYYSSKGKGAHRIKDINPKLEFKDMQEIKSACKKLPAEKPASGVFTIVASRSHNSPETEAFIAHEKEKHGNVTTVSAGSSIKFCLVAEGKADAYPRFAPTMEWDTGAGQAIAEEAGKRVVLIDGKTPLSYNKQSLLNPGFIVI
jgi:3'(2'), 5'-bisphosphate nucleotidase